MKIVRYIITFIFAILIIFTPKDILVSADEIENDVIGSLDVKTQTMIIEDVEADSHTLNMQSNEATYSMADLNQMSNDELMRTLEQIDWEQITDLFVFNGDSNAFYGDQNRVQFLLDELEDRGRTFTPQDSKGIHTIVEVVRAGFYLGFYNDSLSYLNERSFQEKALPALKAMGQNEYFELGTVEQDKVVQAFGSLIGNTASDDQVVRLAAPIMNQIIGDPSLLDDFYKSNAAHFIMQGIDYDLQTVLYNTGKSADQTVWYGQINAYIEALGEAAVIANISGDDEWFLNNAIYYVGRINEFHTDASYAQQKLTEAMEVHAEMSEPYLTAAEQLDDFYNGQDSHGNTIDFDQLLEDAKAYYLPKEYSFEDGKYVFKAGDGVTEEKIQQLYWASKEVEAQFYRFVGTDEPLEIGNPDDVLTVVIYNSPQEYQMNRILNGLDTNNGGIYMEGMGTFFTYERTEQDSIYSLEELFRHEFVHYLQGRYVIPGMWGTGELYANERLTWFEEGGAEFFAGSTRTEGVVPRKSIIEGLALDPAYRQTSYEVLNATYGDFDFYNYSFVLHSYMFNDHFNQYKRLYDVLQQNDVNEYDSIRSDLMHDTQLSNSYQDYMEYLISNKNEFDVPHVSDDYLMPHDEKSLEAIEDELSNHFGLEFDNASTRTSDYFDTFQLEGTYTGTASANEFQDRETMEEEVNEKLKQLEENHWTGYQTLTAYYKNYRVNGQGQFEFDIHINGVYTGDTDPGDSYDIIIRTDIPQTVSVDEDFDVSAEQSEALNGHISSVQWDFGDGTTMDGMNATHQYTEAGTYTISVVLEHSEGLTKAYNQVIEVVDSNNPDPDPDPDPDPNDDMFEYLTGQAVDALTGVWTYGDMESDDYHDVYKFDLDQPGEYSLMMANYSGQPVHWVVYYEETGLDAVAYPSNMEGSVLSGMLDAAQPGTYYVHVYKNEIGNSSYGFSLTQQ